MSKNNAYNVGWLYTMKLAGLGMYPEPVLPVATVGGMAAGGTLGGNIGESLANKTRKTVLGIPLPGTAVVDPDIARAVGSILGAMGGGYLGYLAEQSAPAPAAPWSGY